MSKSSLDHVLECSDFAKKAVERFPQFTQDLLTDVQSQPEPMASCSDMEALKKELRRYRYQALLAITYRDINAINSCEQTLQQLSDTADYLIDQAHQQCKHILNNDAELGILAMGKLGAHELNFSSDIDLIFVLFKGDEVSATRLGQAIIQALGQTTADGFVYRVDMRLRPYGDSGPLVMKAAAMLLYYQKQGRDWERYAMMKARFIGAQHPKWFEEMRDYVYRRYRDYTVREAIVEMYAQIQKEYRNHKLDKHMKLGPGGIREIEFLVQSKQLVIGGRRLSLRDPSVLAALSNLSQLNIIEDEAAQKLREAYLFLRLSENRLQMQEDRQAHHLPEHGHRKTQLATAMGFKTWEAFLQALDEHRQWVIHHRQKILDIEQLPDLPVPKTDELSEELQGLLKKYPQLEPIVPALLHANLPKDLLLDLALLAAKRKTYLSLIKANAKHLPRLFELLTQSPLIKREVLTHPRLLALIMDSKAIKPWERGYLQQQLHDRLCSSDCDELILEALRETKLEQWCRIAVADLDQRYPIMRVSDYLSELAEVIVSEAEQQAWKDMHAKYGYPENCDADQHGFAIVAYGKLGGLELSYNSDLDLVFLYQQSEGKTDGERSISHQEFYARLAQRLTFYLQTRTISGALYEVDNRLRPEGSKGLLVSPIDAFERYQLDKAWTWEHQALVRARAIAGPSHLREAFENIRLKILGQERDVEALRKDVADMREKMRNSLWKGDQQVPGSRIKSGMTPGEKVHISTAKSSVQTSPQSSFRTSIRDPGKIDLKQTPGGIVDIEFIAQFLALAHSHKHPELIEYSDNIRIYEACEKTSVLPPEQAQKLMEVYRSYRKAMHRYTLLEQAEYLQSDVFSEEIKSALTIWQKVLAN